MPTSAILREMVATTDEALDGLLLGLAFVLGRPFVLAFALVLVFAFGVFPLPLPFCSFPLPLDLP